MINFKTNASHQIVMSAPDASCQAVGQAIANSVQGTPTSCSADPVQQGTWMYTQLPSGQSWSLVITEVQAVVTTPSGTNTTATQITTTNTNPIPILDPTTVTQLFSFGFGTVIFCFLLGRGLGTVLSLIRRG
jgi:hypothetical protein